MQKWWRSECYIISLSENWTLTQEKRRADIFRNHIHNWIKFNFYGSISPCLSFRNVDGEEEELSGHLSDFNLQSVRRGWRQIHVVGLVSAAIWEAALPGPFKGSISKGCEHGETWWHRKGETTFCDRVLPSENVLHGVTLGAPCAGLGVGLNHPCVSLTTQNTLWFYVANFKLIIQRRHLFSILTESI